MNVLQRAWRSVIRKPVRSILLLLVIGIISLLFLSGMASRSANIAAKDSTRQAIGAGFLLTKNAENESKRVEELSKKIGGKDGSLEGYHQKKEMIEGQPMWRTWTDNVFHCIKTEDIEKIAGVEGISDYNITTAPTRVKGRAVLRGSKIPKQTRPMTLAVLRCWGTGTWHWTPMCSAGNVSIIEGRMVTPEDTGVCVISEELAEKNGLKIGDTIGFHPIENDGPVSEAAIIGIYQVKEKMTPYMSGDTIAPKMSFSQIYISRKRQNRIPLFLSGPISKWPMWMITRM